MAIQLQLRRGNTTENNTFTGAVGEVTMDTTNDTLRLHDGSTLGGISIDKSENVVHKANNETITGLKTLQCNSSRIIYAKSTIIDNTVTPDSNQHLYIDFLDKNDVRLGVMGSRKLTNGDYGCYMQAGNEGWIGILTDGTNAYTTAPKPDATNSTSDTKIATTGWVNDSTTSTNVVHRTGNETLSGTKTFSTSPVVPTVSITDNSTKAASTEYVNSKLVITNSIPSTGTSGVIYFVYS